MITKSINLIKANLTSLLLIGIPMLVPVSIYFTSGSSGNLDDPELPFWFKLMKDVVYFAIIAVILFFSFLKHRLTIPLFYFLYLLVPLILVVIMTLLYSIKFGAEHTPVTQIRNLGFYPPLGGIVALLAFERNIQHKLFQVFRIIMCLGVLAGLSFYLFADNIWLFTVHGRMIGTVANPNSFGLLCFLWLVLLNGLARERPAKLIHYLEACLALIGLVTSGSLAAALCFGLWLIIIAVGSFFRSLVRATTFSPFLVFQCIFPLMIAAVGLIIIVDTIPLSFALQLIEKTQGYGSGESADIRLADSQFIAEQLQSLPFLLFGQTLEPDYRQFDGATPSLLFNFGLPFLILWLLYWLIPVLLVFFGMRSNKSGEIQTLGLINYLALFLLITVVFNFSVQYAPQFYPTCLILSWIMHFLLINTISKKRIVALNSE